MKIFGLKITKAPIEDRDALADELAMLKKEIERLSKVVDNLNDTIHEKLLKQEAELEKIT